MGEEDKLEPTEAKEVDEENLSAKVIRKRTKQLYNSIRDLMEFWFSDVNLEKDRFLSQLIFSDPWVDLEVFLKFNKLRALTMNLNDVVNALRKSKMLQVSEDGTKVCRVTPFGCKEDVDACTIYVEQIQPDVEHDWLKSVFSEFGPIDYISLPRFKATQKPKGFAFIEFKTAESAKKAIEAFRAKGFCLSPQMDPEKLASIATFEKDNNQLHEERNVHLDEAVVQCDTKQEISPKTSKIEENVEPECETENKEVGENITSESGLREDDAVNHRGKEHKSNIDQNEEEIDECKIDDDNIKEKKGKKRKKRISEDKLIAENEEENCVSDEKPAKRSKVTLSSETELEGTKTKKEKISDASLEAEGNELTNMENERDFESMQEIESARDENEYEEKKNKRKRRKKHKKNVCAISYGLQIMPKVEWKRLRNTYLNLQKQKMKQLKQHIRQFPYGQRTPKWQSYNYYENEGVNNKIDVDRNGTDKKKGLEYTPGVIIKVTLDEPVIDVKGIKSSARIHPEVRYVDANEGDQEIYLRVGAPELADQVLTTKHWSHMELLQGKEEKQYWDKIMKDREEKFSKKIRVNQRGRDKLLKKAEIIQEKHVGFDER